MSRASEWAARQLGCPAIEFVSQHGDYRIMARVSAIYGPHREDDSVLALGLRDTEGASMAIRAENALALAAWIVDVFGEPKP